MLDKIFTKDTFLVGVIVGLAIPGFCYGLTLFSLSLKNSITTPSFHENLQLLLIAINAVIMRYFMVNREQDRIGQGIMGVTLLMALAWVIFYQAL